MPAPYLDAILKLALQAPSGYNLQPWRFIIVQDEQNRNKLQKAAWSQEKITEAPVVTRLAFRLAFTGPNLVESNGSDLESPKN